jgi:alpha,alpha-trehalase
MAKRRDSRDDLPAVPAMTSSVSLSRERFDAVIFDLDGVVTRTADVHAAAWKRLFDDFLRERARREGVEFTPFSEQDYLDYVDGKPRSSGIESFLQARGIELPRGSPEDDRDAKTVCGLGNRKNEYFRQHLDLHGVEAYQSTLSLIDQLRSEGFKVAVISASRNCKAVLKAAGAEHLFATRVDGQEAARLKLAGKPAPDVFLEAARRLQVPPERAVIVEDAQAGVEAGRSGGFGLVIGVNRSDQAAALCDAGADVVVDDLAEVTLEDSPHSSSRKIAELPSAMESLEEISRTPQTKVVVFLDYDGTLTPIVERPEDAHLPPGTRQAIAKLAEHCTVAIISGRDLPDVRGRVGLDHLIYAGSHGFDIAGPEGLRMVNEEAESYLPSLDEAEAELSRSLKTIEGAQVERKKFSIAIHYRRVPPHQHEAVSATVEKVAKKHAKLRQGSGKMVYELQPNIDWHKGKAVLWLMDALGLDRTEILPVYLGDDVTDEDAFRALPRKGLGIVVEGGDHPSAAAYSLKDPGEVRQFLQRLTAELSVGASTDSWELDYDGFLPSEEKLREALCTLGNGYFATRGAAAESSAGEIHYPGTYLACGYNRLKSRKGGREIENEDLVNLPNWLPLTFRVGDGPWFNPAEMELLYYRQKLQLKTGVLQREVRFRDSSGRVTFFRQRRLVHMKDPHVAALETVVRAENWSGTIEFRSGLDGDVENTGVPRYHELNSRHLVPRETRQIDEETILLKVETSQSEIRIAEAARTRLYRKNHAERESPPRETIADTGKIEQRFSVTISEGEEVTVEKIVGFATSRDHGISEAGLEAGKWAARAPRFASLLQGHSLAWKQLWRRFNIDIEANGGRTALILRLHCFHLLQTASLHTMELDVGVPSRGWHGEAYRGHIFWDELFIFPFLNLRLPEITRKLLIYRYRRLNEARHAAREEGFPGAMFPWQSGSDGREETQTIHLNPASGRWLPDNSHLQRHVNAAIAYNVWQYYQATADSEFLSYYGAEMLLEIARFLAGLASWNDRTQRFDITGVMGPDEYHDAMPGSGERGLRNNAYTNVMTSWVLQRAEEALGVLPEDRRSDLCELLQLEEEEIVRWNEISRKLTVPFHEEDIISQFEGYETLQELDWTHYRSAYGNVLRLDRILEAEGDTPNRYKASKQADVLMLFYLFSTGELTEIFERLGYPLNGDMIRRNIEYYVQRTSHGSTLSHVVHSWVTARSDRNHAWQLFLEGLESDIADVQGGTTPEGIHLGAMAGTVDLLQRCFTGIETRGNVLHLNPNLPAELKSLCLRLRYRGHSLTLEIESDTATLRSLRSSEHPIKISHNGQERLLEEGTVYEFRLPSSSS